MRNRAFSFLLTSAIGAGLCAAGGAFGPHGDQGAHPALVAGAPRLDALPQPGFLVGQAFIKLLVLDRSIGQPLLLAPEKRRVVARSRRQAAAIQLDDARGEPLQECAIVRDERSGDAIVFGLLHFFQEMFL